MTTRIITADEAASLLGAATRGPWCVWSDEGPIVLPTGQRAGGWTCSICRGEPTSDSDHACVGYSVARVVAQAAEIDALRAILAAAPDLAATVVAQAAEIDALRAIIDGRATPPTIKEARAHSHGTRGAFVVMLGDGAAHYSARVVTGLQRFEKTPQRWWPLDSEGRPCAWPVVTEVAR
jgi:hypothetical protein